MLITMFAIMTMCFILVRLLPNQIPDGIGDSAAAKKAMMEAWGYNKPILTQYAVFLKNVFTAWDWGFCTTVGTFLGSVTEYISLRLPASVILNVYSILFSIPIGIGLGVFAALKKNKWQDQTISVVVMLFISVPSYVYAFLIQYYFGFKLNLFPLVVNAGTNYLDPAMLKSLVLPVLSISFGTMATFMRFTRAELTETLTSDYMLLARAKGLTNLQATMRHAFRNALVPIFPMIISQFIGVLSGSLVIEKIFAVPGIGNAYVASVNLRDYNVFIAISMFYVAIGLIAGICVDLSYGIIDPRIRMGGGKTNA